MIHFFRNVQKIPKTKVMKIGSTIGSHDLTYKLGRIEGFLKKGLTVEMQFEHVDIKKRNYLRRVALSENRPMDTKVGWNIDKEAYNRIVLDSIQKLKPYTKAQTKLTNDPFLVQTKLTSNKQE